MPRSPVSQLHQKMPPRRGPYFVNCRAALGRRLRQSKHLLFKSWTRGRLVLIGILSVTLLIIAIMVGLTLWSFVSDKANDQESIYRACIESGRSANLCSA